MVIEETGMPDVQEVPNGGSANALDRQIIREIIENWVIWRDAGMWDKFRTLWHDDGVMNATWFQGPVDEFIAHGSKGGSNSHHVLGGTSVEVNGTRAIAQTKMTIALRAAVEDVQCDIASSGRFFDFFENRGGRWGMVCRQPIYEKDRLDPVVPGERPRLSTELLAKLPEGYRYLAYAQTRGGLTVKRDMPGLKGSELEALYARGEAWLKGESKTP
jgi:hypothetical protein